MGKEYSKDISNQIDHLFRHEYGKLVSVLTKTFGASNMELAEDVVQEAMIKALEKWSYSGVPDNAVGWIYKVAKNKTVNIINREKYKRTHSEETLHQLKNEWMTNLEPGYIFTDEEIADDQLRMIFTCCHPSISVDSQIALTLKTLCGFSIPEIAQAFLTSEENINKRLVRARKTIRQNDIAFDVPVGNELQSRLNSVLETIYLLFNEGYHASHGDEIIRFELCEEAIRLTEMIIRHKNFDQSSNTYALLSLMSLNAARFKARMDNMGQSINLANQNRRLWDKNLIKQGIYYLEFATSKNEVSIYHILATISAAHCTAPSYDTTDWKGILDLYDMLIRLDSSPLILLNRAIVLSKTESAHAALNAIDQIKDQSSFSTYLPFYITKAELHFLDNDRETAVNLLKKALNHTSKSKIKQLINSKINVYLK